MPEGGRRDEGPHPGATQDVPHLLRTVEVDDGHHRRPQQGGGVEGDGGLRPVGQLERHRVARSHPPFGQRPRQPQRARPQLAERARPGPRPRMDPEFLVGMSGECLVEQVPEGPVVPQPLGQPAPLELGRDRPERPPGRVDGIGRGAGRGHAHGARTTRASRTSTATVRDGTGGAVGGGADRSAATWASRSAMRLPPLDEPHPPGVGGVGGECVVDAAGLRPGGGDLRRLLLQEPDAVPGLDLEDSEHDDHGGSFPRLSAPGRSARPRNRTLR